MGAAAAAGGSADGDMGKGEHKAVVKDPTASWKCLGWQRRGAQGKPRPPRLAPLQAPDGHAYVPLGDEVQEFVQRCFEDRMLGKLQVDWWSTSAGEPDGSSVYSQAMAGPVGGWNSNEVCEWLKGIGLSEYAPEFLLEGVDGLTLLSMMEVELIDNCCVEDERARRYLMKQIARLHMHSCYPDSAAGEDPLSGSGAATAKAMGDFGHGDAQFGRFVQRSACIDGPAPTAPGGPQARR